VVQEADLRRQLILSP